MNHVFSHPHRAETGAFPESSHPLSGCHGFTARRRGGITTRIHSNSNRRPPMQDQKNPHPHHAPQQDGRSVLSHAQALRNAGRHHQAIDCLEGAMRTGLRRNEVFAGMALALKARSQVHLMDDAGAMLTTGLVPAIVRQFNPKVDAYCQMVAGLVHRRRAYRGWKAGSPEPHILEAAVECFRQAGHAAESAIEPRLASIAALNGLYAQGLEAAIAGRSPEINPGLLVPAVEAEAAALDRTPAGDAPGIAGLVIIADLAIGGGLQPRELYRLSEAPAFRAACLKLLGGHPGTWAQELLRAATAPRVPAEQKSRALILGSRQMTGGGEAAAGPAHTDLVQAYLVHLADCDFSLRKAAAEPDAPAARQFLGGMAGQLALLTQLSGQAAPGRRRFR